MTGVITSQLKVNKGRPVSKYIFIILLAFDLNKHRTKKSNMAMQHLHKAVTWKQKALCCDSCETWFHIKCQHIQSNIFRFMNASNISWECLQCNVECQIVLPHCLIPPIPLKLKSSFQVSVSVPI